jgi:AraC-like DNA-binding protein
VAAEVGYSPSHLGYLFSTYLGYSVSDFLLTLRVAEATRLLKDFDLTVSGIASAVGYSDPAHLTRAFKRAVGISPAVYRQRLKQRRPVVPGDLPSSERGQLALPPIA